MDILRPSLINIDGRIYRRNIIKEEQYQEEEDFSCMGPLGKLRSVSVNSWPYTYVVCNVRLWPHFFFLKIPVTVIYYF